MLVLQSLSFRNAYFGNIMHGLPGFEPENILCDADNPNPLGHRQATTFFRSHASLRALSKPVPPCCVTMQRAACAHHRLL